MGTTETDTADHPRTSTASRWHRFRTGMRTAGHYCRRHAERAWVWAQAQPRHRWGEIAVGTALAVLALALLFWTLSSVLGGSEPAPPPPPPPAAGADQPPPRWLAEVNHVGLWHGIGHTLTSYAADNAPAAGMPPWLLLSTWSAIGGLLLLGSWFATKRFGIATAAWCVWLAATAWVLWTHTPGGSPVPAVLTAACGVTAAAVPISTPLLAAFVALGLAPSIT